MFGHHWGDIARVNFSEKAFFNQEGSAQSYLDSLPRFKKAIFWIFSSFECYPTQGAIRYEGARQAIDSERFCDEHREEIDRRALDYQDLDPGDLFVEGVLSVLSSDDEWHMYRHACKRIRSSPDR